MITIRRIEREILTNRERPIDENIFPDRDTAFLFLSEHVSILTPGNMAEIMRHPTTIFEALGMISAGSAAYSARIIYEIEVNP